MRKVFLALFTLMALMQALSAVQQYNSFEECKNLCVFSYSNALQLDNCIKSCEVEPAQNDKINGIKNQAKETEYDFSVARALPRPKSEAESIIAPLFVFFIGTSLFIRHKARESWIKGIAKKPKGH